MNSRYLRSAKKEKIYEVSIDSFIERLKKVRALNCNPSDIGIDSYVWKKISSNRSDTLTRFL